MVRTSRKISGNFKINSSSNEEKQSKYSFGWWSDKTPVKTHYNISNEKMKRTQSLTVCSCHVTYAFQSESTFYSCLHVKELLTRSRREI